jgi:DNA polymerase elongation subunit (family B)
MIIANNENQIYKSWKDEYGKLQVQMATHRPYFFVPATYKEVKSYKTGPYLKRPLTYEQGEWYSIDGKKLKKVYYHLPRHVEDAKKPFIHPTNGDMTYEADVSVINRYAVDNITEMPEYKLTKFYWDMEWQQGGEHDGKITAIALYNNETKEFNTWVWHPDGNHEELNKPSIEGYHCLLWRSNSEEEMLGEFLGYLCAKNPDMMIAWFGLKFDLPKLLSRCVANGIDPRVFSPLGVIDGVNEDMEGNLTFSKEKGYSPIAQPVKGRLMLNLDVAFERQWNDAQKGTLPSLSLDFVSKTLFGEGKHIETKFTDPNEFYSRAWLEDTESYLQYTITDVELLRRIDEENHCSEAIIALQRLLKAPFESCFFASHMGSIYFMRNASWKCKTGKKLKTKKCEACGFENPKDKQLKTCKKCGESLSYSGAMIYHPVKEGGTNGLHRNVAAFDFAGLYPSMIVARNISFETVSDTPTLFGADLNTPQNLQPLPEDYTEDMVYFKTDELGLLPRSILELKALRNDYKKEMKDARENGLKGDVVKWNNNQMAVKRLMASFYGILAFKGFGWADSKLAASITASAREAIREAAKVAKEMEI